MEDIAIRNPRPSEMGFIFDSWIRSCEDFPRDSKRHWIERELHRPSTELKVAVFVPEGDDAEVVLGWCATRGDCVLYVYVKLQYRGAGIARMLLEGGEWTRCQAMPRTRRIPEGWRYDRWA